MHQSSTWHFTLTCQPSNHTHLTTITLNLIVWIITSTRDASQSLSLSACYCIFWRKIAFRLGSSLKVSILSRRGQSGCRFIPTNQKPHLIVYWKINSQAWLLQIHQPFVGKIRYLWSNMWMFGLLSLEVVVQWVRCWATPQKVLNWNPLKAIELQLQSP